MKKLLPVLAGLFLFVPLMAQALTISERENQLWSMEEQVYPDVPSLHVNYNAVGMLSAFGVIKGYPDGTFKPENPINRAELTKMVVAMMEPDTDLSSYNNCFPDVKDEWFAPYICFAKAQGWVSGYPDGTFKPGNPVNRVEAIKINLNVLIPDDLWPTPTDAELQLPMPADAESGAWYGGYLAFSIAKELLDGQHVYEDENGYYYKPGESMTRKEVAEMIYRVSNYMLERLEFADLTSMAACVQIENEGVMTEEEMHDAWVQDLADQDMTEADADKLAAKYGEDDVTAALIQDFINVTCLQQEVDMTRWAQFGKFTR